MLICFAQNLAYLAVPKTGTTAIEGALRPRADIIFAQGRKHMPAQRFHNKVAPFLADTFGLHPDRIAMMRNPEDQLSSWYRYRTTADERGTGNSTASISFDQFVRDVISDDPPPHARIGSQFRFLTSGKGDVLVHRLFAYEQRGPFQRFLEDRFDERLEFPTANVSPAMETELEPSTRARLREARPDEFALYQDLLDKDGALQVRPNGA